MPRPELREASFQAKCARERGTHEVSCSRPSGQPPNTTLADALRFSGVLHLPRYHRGVAPDAVRVPRGAVQPMKHSMGIDVLSCPRCQGRLKPIGLITEQEVSEKILVHLNLPLRPEQLHDRMTKVAGTK